MAGFPHTQLNKYLRILLQELNKKVALSEEYIIPPSRKASSGGLMFDRMVKRVVTPGTLIDESFLNPHQNNYLLALHLEDAIPASKDGSQPHVGVRSTEAEVGMAWMDLSTGEFRIGSTTPGRLPTSLARINPSEILLDSTIDTSQVELLASNAGHTWTYHKPDEAAFSLSRWSHMFEDDLCDKDFSLLPAENHAIHLLLSYAHSNVDVASLKLQHPVRPNLQDIMTIDRSSLRGLEILETARDGLHQGSLLQAVRRTVTKGGARLLRSRLTSPSASLVEVEARLDLVTTFLNRAELRQNLIELLRKTFDTVRLIQKIALNRGEPDDLISLARAIQASDAIQSSLQQASTLR